VKNIRWIIQNNLGSAHDIDEMKHAFQKSGIDFFEIAVIPFSSEIPAFPQDEKMNIYYGATTLMYNIYRQHNKPPGLFFDEERFSMENYLAIWKGHMLNSEAKVTTFKEFAGEDHAADSLWFMRPDADDKSFNGDVHSFGDIRKFIKNAVEFDNVILTENTKILVGPPYKIEKEWRNYIVDGKVITSSLYRQDSRLNKSRENIPAEMIRFVEDRCADYMPHKIFAMDIALCGGDYYIIECGCLNSVGFYAADIPKLIRAVSEYVAEHYGN
jgi:hypothetical protein